MERSRTLDWLVFWQHVPDLFPRTAYGRHSCSGNFLGHDARVSAGAWLRMPGVSHPSELAAGFMRDAQRVSKSLSAATGAVKLNYEIHGNSLPHLHMHFFPRYRGDRFEGRPIDPKSVFGAVYFGGEFQKIRDAFLLHLGQ
jgi:hypothetical protein